MKIFNNYKPTIEMKYIYLQLIGSLFFLNYIVQNVLYQNQINEVYSAESDSISIPIYVTLITTVIISILELLGILLASQKWLGWMGIGLTFISFTLAVGSCLEWLSPNHLLIAASHLPILFICGYISIRSLYIWKELSE